MLLEIACAVHGQKLRADLQSGKVSVSQRLQFKALLGQIHDGETLVVSKLDCLGRNAPDVGATIKALVVRKIEVIVLQFGKLDLASPACRQADANHVGRHGRDGT